MEKKLYFYIMTPAMALSSGFWVIANSYDRISTVSTDLVDTKNNICCNINSLSFLFRQHN